jgi:hypothetical protein
VDVQALLALIAGAIIHHTIVVMLVIVIVMMMAVMMVPMAVVAMMNMARLIACVHVNPRARECAGWYRQSHADGRRQGEHNRHRPDEGNVTSACSFQLRQHALRSTISGRPF